MDGEVSAALDYEWPTRVPRPPMVGSLTIVALNTVAALVSFTLFLAAWHLAGCRVMTNHWCELAAIVELFVAIPIWLILFTFSVCVEQVWMHKSVLVAVLLLLAVSGLNIVFLFAAKASGPWW